MVVIHIDTANHVVMTTVTTSCGQLSPPSQIQSYWRGYCVRGHVFNYRAYRNYMLALQQKKAIVRGHLQELWQRTQAERLERREQLQEVGTEWSYVCSDGVGGARCGWGGGSVG